MNNDKFEKAREELNKYIRDNPLHWEFECLQDWLSVHSEYDDCYRENEERYFELQRLIDNGGK